MSVLNLFCNIAAPGVAFVQKFSRKGLGRHGVLSFPIGVTATQDLIIVGDNGNDCVKLFSKDGTHKTTIGVRVRNISQIKSNNQFVCLLVFTVRSKEHRII